MRRTANLLLRALGGVGLLAVVSLWVQIEGLVGEHGILPAERFLDAVERSLGAERFTALPTLLWIDASDLALHFLCALVAGLSLLLLLGFASRLSVALTWLGYLSLVQGGQTFLAFQWDALLLEALLFSLFLVPGNLLPRRLSGRRDDPRLGIWLVRLLALKLMVLSGLVKPLSFDRSWLELTALDYHYWTQPLPNPLAWYTAHLPATIQRLSVLAMYAVEIAVPFAVFGPRRLRLAAGGVLIAFQVGIEATGNYGFFNLLTAVLCLSYLDDRALPRSPRHEQSHAARSTDGDRSRLFALLGGWWARAAAALLLLVSLLVSVRELARTVPPSKAETPIGRTVLGAESALSFGTPLLAVAEPWRSINGYGLFRALTTERPEINLEISDDGDSWQELPFRYKPVDPSRPLPLVAPHMPRLDWQMWFAALAPRRADWLEPLLSRLVAGEPSVVGLLDPAASPLLRASPSAGDGSASGGPRFVRLVLWRYRFSTVDERRETGAPWVRERVGELTEPLPRERLATLAR